MVRGGSASFPDMIGWLFHARNAWLLDIFKCFLLLLLDTISRKKKNGTCCRSRNNDPDWFTISTRVVRYFVRRSKRCTLFMAGVRARTTCLRLGGVVLWYGGGEREGREGGGGRGGESEGERGRERGEGGGMGGREREGERDLRGAINVFAFFFVVLRTATSRAAKYHEIARNIARGVETGPFYGRDGVTNLETVK